MMYLSINGRDKFKFSAHQHIHVMHARLIFFVCSILSLLKKKRIIVNLSKYKSRELSKLHVFVFSVDWTHILQEYFLRADDAVQPNFLSCSAQAFSG